LNLLPNRENKPGLEPVTVGVSEDTEGSFLNLLPNRENKPGLEPVTVGVSEDTEGSFLNLLPNRENKPGLVEAIGLTVFDGLIDLNLLAD